MRVAHESEAAKARGSSLCPDFGLSFSARDMIAHARAYKKIPSPRSLEVVEPLPYSNALAYIYICKNVIDMLPHGVGRVWSSWPLQRLLSFPNDRSGKKKQQDTVGSLTRQHHKEYGGQCSSRSYAPSSRRRGEVASRRDLSFQFSVTLVLGISTSKQHINKI